MLPSKAPCYSKLALFEGADRDTSNRLCEWPSLGVIGGH